MVEEVRGRRVFYRRNRMDRHYQPWLRPFPQRLFNRVFMRVRRAARHKVAPHA